MSTIAVLITYHNEAELLSECLQSLLEQSSPVDAICVYDDASDHPARDFLPQAVAVQILEGAEVIGPSRGRNVLLSAVDCEYVHFHDADDVFEPGWCSGLREAIDETGADVVFTNVASFDDSGSVCDRVMDLSALMGLSDQRALIEWSLRGSVLTPSSTLRRSVTASIGGYRESLWQSEDFDFHVRLAASGVSYAIIPAPLVRIRLRPDGRSRKYPSEPWRDRIRALSSLADELPQEYHNLLGEAAAEAGSVLWRLGDRNAAREGFRLGKLLGAFSFPHASTMYGAVARLVGQAPAERVAGVYRALAAEPLRRGFRDLSSLWQRTD